MKQLLCLLCGMGLWLVQVQTVNAQSIRRQTICSVGTVQTTDNLRVSSSTGQKSVACSVIFNGNNYLRQGFQQPTQQGEPCPHTSAFEVEEITEECGVSYNFEYTGNADIDQATFAWDFGDEAAPMTSTEQNPSGVIFASTGPKTVSLRVTFDGCENGVSAVIQINGTGFAALTDISDVNCFGDANGSISLDIFGADMASITWDDGSTDTLRTGLAAGAYSFTLTNPDNACEYSETVTIEGPQAALSVTGVTVQETCDAAADGSIELAVQNATGAVTYEWNPATAGDGPIVSGLTEGTYGVVVIDANNCRAEESFTITQFCDDPDLPDTFTPNGDGINDTWVIPGIENFPNNEINLYNRWGQLVWNVQGYMNDWTGTNNEGEELPFGAYYYVIEFNDAAETVAGGSLTIIR